MDQDRHLRLYQFLNSKKGVEFLQGSHNVYTPQVLVEEILSNVNGLNDAKSILVLFNLEFVIGLVYTYGVNSNSVTFYSDGANKTSMASRMGVKVITSLENNMKFDVVVGNPPFSAHGENKKAGKRGTEIYVEFFRKATEMAPVVAMILPTSDKKVQAKHNALLKEKANKIVYIDEKVFSGITMPMWYVIVDGSEEKPTVEFNIHGVTGNLINWQKGKVNMTAYKNLTGGHGQSAKTDAHDVIIYHKLNSSGLVIKYGQKTEFSDCEFFPKSGYAVLMPQTITDDGWSKVEIVECTGNQVAFNGMSIVFTKTKEQADNLVKVMNTDSFKQQANKVKQGFNNMNLSCLKAINIHEDIVRTIQDAS
jgi:hypothetical protein